MSGKQSKSEANALLEAVVGRSRGSIKDKATAEKWDAAVSGVTVPSQQGGCSCGCERKSGHVHDGADSDDSDGTSTSTNSAGESVTHYNNGSSDTHHADGSHTFTSSDGTTSHYW
jgi:hypothetical protein